jgi:hypothetical protein
MTKTRKIWAMVVVVVLLLGIAGIMGISGCGGSASSDQYTATTLAGGVVYGVTDSSAGYSESAALAPAADTNKATQSGGGVSLTSQQTQAGQKIMKTAVLDLEVAKGDFQAKFQKAQQLGQWR